MSQESNRRWMIADLKDQLGSVLDTLFKLRDRVMNLKARLAHFVDQGEGMTQEQLAEVYAEIDRLFPHRDRSTPESLDVRL